MPCFLDCPNCRICPEQYLLLADRHRAGQTLPVGLDASGSKGVPDHGDCRLNQLAGRNDYVRQAQYPPFDRIDAVVQRDQLGGAIQSDKPRQSRGAAPAGDQSQSDLRKAHLRCPVGTQHPVVAPTSKFRSTTQTDAVHRGYGDIAADGQTLEGRLRPDHALENRGRSLVDHATDGVNVRTGEKRARFRGRNDQPQDLCPSIQLVQHGIQFGQRITAQYIDALSRRIQLQAGDVRFRKRKSPAGRTSIGHVGSSH